MKLQHKFFIIFFLIAATPILSITAVSYHRYFTTTYAQMDEYSHNIFEKATQQTNATLDQVHKAANMFTFYSNGNNSLIQNLKPYADTTADISPLEIYQTKQNIKYMCLNISNSYEFIHGLYVFTPSGIILDYDNTPNTRLQPGYDPAQDEWFQDTQTLQGRLYISGISTHNEIFSGDKESIFFAKYLYDVYSHKYLGVLLINCSPDIFQLDNLNVMPDIVEFYLSNQRTGEMIIGGQDQPPAASAKTEVLSTDLMHSDLSLTASINYQKLYKNFNLTGTVLIALAVTSLFTALLLSYFLSHYLTRPIVRLSQIMSQQQGDPLLPTESYHARQDEIGVLYNEYNQMMIKLQDYIKTDYQNKLIAMDAQMKSLEACINSHFLFNTLSSINSIAVIEGSEQLSAMSIALGNMFRYAIKTKSELVTLAEELNHVKDYITIQSIRFDHAFTFETEIPKDMLPLPVLKLILQPLVENAMIHGLSNCQTGSLIRVTANRSDTLITLTVADDGQGMEPEQLTRLQNALQEEPAFIELGHRNNHSIGIRNISSRIRLYYGERYGLSIISSKQTGTSVTIHLPILEDNKLCTDISL